MVVFREIKSKYSAGVAGMIQSPKEHFFLFPTATCPMTVAQVKERVRSKKAFVVMIEDEQLIGFANLYEEKGFIYIGNLAISPAYRGKGHATTLIVHMMAIAIKKFQVSEVRIAADSRNEVTLSI